MSLKGMSDERKNELRQWATLGTPEGWKLSASALAEMYGVSPETIWFWRRKAWGGRAGPNGGPGRYPKVSDETVAEIVEELQNDDSKGRRGQVAEQYGLDPSTVSRIALRHGLPKKPWGRRSRYDA